MEFLITLVYAFFAFWFIFKAKFFRFKNLSHLFCPALFLFKIGVGFALYYYYAYGQLEREYCDIFKYFDDGSLIYNALFTKPLDFIQLLFGVKTDTSYFYDNYYSKFNFYDSEFGFGALFLTRFVAGLQLFTGGYYAPAVIFFIFFSFCGIIAFVRFFRTYQPRKTVWFLILFNVAPSFAFWSSGILKESLIIFSLGFLLLYFKEKRYLKPGTLIIPLTLLALLFGLRFYVFVILALLLPAFIIVNHRAAIRRAVIPYLTGFILGTPLVLGIIQLLFKKSFFEFIFYKRMDFIALAERTNAATALNMNPVSPDFWSFFGDIPQALWHATVFPYPYFTSSPLVFLNALEIIFFAAFGCLPFIFPQKLKKKTFNLLIFCVLFLILNLIIIGWSTSIVGAIVRYKSILLPFYAGIILILTDMRKKKFLSNPLHIKITV